MKHLLVSAPAACLALGAAAQAPAPVPSPVPAPQQIQITGGREAETDQRRQSTAAKIVIGREEIDKFGDASIGEVLRRLPGVTTPGAPGRGGPPRMRGLGGGYTQILVDGERMAPGFSLESLPPEQVERIEILRAPTAETGARAIAGTINIITREGFRRRANDLRPGVGFENGAFSSGLNWTHNDSAGDFIYNVSGSAFTNRRNTGSQTRTVTTLPDGTVDEATLDTGAAHEIRKGTSLNARLQWRLADGDSLQLTPNLFHMETRAERPFTQLLEAGAGPLRYDDGSTGSGSNFTSARLNGQWRQRLGDDLRMELALSGSGSRSKNDSLRIERLADTQVRALQDTSNARENGLHLRSKFSQLVGESEHSLVGGLEAEAQRRHETRVTVDNGVQQLTQFGDTLQAQVLRLAAYAQDEWNLTPQWAVHAGLRWEGITTRGEAEPGVRPSNRSSVATPLLHAVWKPDPKSRDQVRISLTRSYRSPGLDTLIAKPRLSSKFPADQTNDPTSPDRAGNPDLKPELATGIDVAAERYLEGGGLLSANLFHRRISNLMRAVIGDAETVSWSSQPRYVSRQQNIGRATTQGLELEAKFALDQLLEGAPRVELRANAALYRSRVDSVPGPDNRLAEQAKATANLGADYRFRAVPLSVGGNVNWVPAYETQLSEEQRTATGRKRVFDLYALWTFSPAVGLRVLANNLAPLDYENTNTITTPAFTEQARSFGPSWTNWQLRLELKL